MRWAGSATARHATRDGTGVGAPRPRRWALLAATMTVALAAGLAAGTAPAAGAATVKTATPDTVVRIPTPLVTLGVPADGRLNVLGLSGQVLGAATGPRDGLGPDQVNAGTGQRLWVFGLRWTTQPQQGHTVGVSALLLAGPTDQIPIPLPASADRVGGGSSGPMYFRASVPAGVADVAVQLSADGFSQTFSLTHLAREGTQPTALYRDPSSWEQTVEQHAEIDLPTPDNDADNLVPNAVLPIKLAATHLSAFDPADPASATTPGQAWLTVDLSSQVEDVDLGTGAYLDYQTAVTGAAVTLTLPGGAPMPATTFPGGPDTAGVGIFTDRFTFPVPATFTTASLVVNPGPLQAVPDDEVGPMPDTVTPAMPATFALDVPQLPFTPAAGAATHAAVIPAGASTSPKPPTSGPEAATTTSTGGSSATPALALAALVAAALVIVGIILRRRHHQPAAAAPLPTPAPPLWRPPPPTSTPPAPTGFWAAGPTPTPTPQAAPPPEPEPPPPAPSTPVLSRPVVRVLGPVEIERWERAPERKVVPDVVVYLACHAEAPVGTDQLRNALSAGKESEVTAKTLQTYLTYARTALGSGRIPGHGGDGYRLVDVDCDWSRMRELTRRAREHPDQALDLLRRALSEVRGQPFPDTKIHPWAHEDGTANQMTRTIVETATRLADLATAAGDHRTADWAIHTASPLDPLDEPLATAALDSATAQRRPDLLARAWRDITTSYERAGLHPSPALAAHYRKLANTLEP